MISSNVVLTGSHNHPLVALSVFIAISSSFAALDMAGRITVARGRVRLWWLAGGAVSLGLGIWAMHYVGMLAFQLPVEVRYHWPTVLLSVLTAIICSALALDIVSRGHLKAVPAWTSSFIIGSGISGMHYIGMAAMRLPAVRTYNHRLVLLSIAFAVLFSFLALRLAFFFRKDPRVIGLRKINAALVMGTAVSAMHYTGMAAARFTPSPLAPNFSHSVDISLLGALAIALATLVVQGAAILTCIVDRQFALRADQLQLSEQRYGQLLEAEASLHQLSADLLHTQDEERRRIARELHETAAQTLVALKMNLAKISRSECVRDPNTNSALAESIALAEECMKEIRTLSYLLHPPLLDEAGLGPALRWYATGFAERSGIAADLNLPPDLSRLPEEVETAIFRIVQEALTNIHRHSGSATATIALRQDVDHVELEVKDQGRGMGAVEVKKGAESPVTVGVGIAGMRERVNQLGGRLDIRSDKYGTTIKVTLPMNGVRWQEFAS
ncbi:MAG TPA: MHYT domain-containing protein [Terriglobales bacterium]|nr:MHYT domain-containing protein [Terriglobales bacterium]